MFRSELGREHFKSAVIEFLRLPPRTTNNPAEKRLKRKANRERKPLNSPLEFETRFLFAHRPSPNPFARELIENMQVKLGAHVQGVLENAELLLNFGQCPGIVQK